MKPLSLEASFLSALLGDAKLVVADVGAANGVLPHFRPALEVATFFLFEPEKEAYEKLQAQFFESPRKNAHLINTALSAAGGKRAFYMTNRRTGSSLLPIRSDAMEYGQSSYFFPQKEVEIETKKIQDVLEEAGEQALHMIKIDVQGGELEVLQGMSASQASTLLSAEVEIGMPGSYVGEPTLADIDTWMKPRGLVLFDIMPARAQLTLDDDRHAYHTRVFETYRSDASVRSRVWYVEAFYFREEDRVLKTHQAQEVRRLSAAYALHGFFAHAYRLTTKALDAKILSQKQASEMHEILKRWHNIKLDRSLFGRTKRFLKRFLHRVLTPEQAAQMHARFSGPIGRVIGGS